jgi:hypothetical protein
MGFESPPENRPTTGVGNLVRHPCASLLPSHGSPSGGTYAARFGLRCPCARSSAPRSEPSCWRISETSGGEDGLLRGVFEVLEYDPDGRPGSQWSSATTQALGELFAQFGITFTSPDQADTQPEPPAQTRPDQTSTGR